MPNGHGGVPRFGSPFLALAAAVLSVRWLKTEPQPVAQILAYFFAVVAAWRLAFHLTMWDVSDYGGGYSSNEEKRKAKRKYLIATAALVPLSVIVLCMFTR